MIKSSFFVHTRQKGGFFMVKKILAGCLAVAVLGGLAYYSSYLYSSRQLQEGTLRSSEEETELVRKIPGVEILTEWQEREAEEEEEKEEERTETAAAPDALEVEQGDVSYYLIEEFGYVNIYLSDKETLYENTGIAIGLLPEELQREICLGKAIANEQELYDFLENYSS